MRGRAFRQAAETSWAIVASTALHVLVAFVLVLLPAPPRPEPPPESSIAVEIITPEQFETATRQPGTAPSPASPSPQPPENQPRVIAKPSEPQPGAMVRATQLYSSKRLSDPRSKQAREALQLVSTDERIEQLCDLEALEQIHEWNAGFEPDFLIAYAMAETRMSELTMEAKGGAFRSKRHWYNVSYKCEMSPDFTTVASLEFLVGKEIPKSEWQNHDLSADDSPAD